MRRGCISLGEIRCDSCKKIVPPAGRYMVTDEELDTEGKKKLIRYCIECCVEKGLAGHRREKDEKILTIFPAEEKLETAPSTEKPETEESEEKLEEEKKEE